MARHDTCRDAAKCLRLGLRRKCQDSGHSVPEEQPETLAKAVLDFI